MYICVCKAVTDGQIRTAIDNGICTRRQLVHCFGVGKDCGKCNKEVSELLKQRSEQNSIYSDGVIKHLTTEGVLQKTTAKLSINKRL